jgi:hypothetical protein
VNKAIFCVRKGERMHALQEQFGEQGYVILKGIFSPDVLDGVRSELELLVDQTADTLIDAGKIQDRFASEPFETRFFRFFEGHMDDAPKSFRRELRLTCFLIHISWIWSNCF